MPRKVKDPIVQVMQYFETSSIDTARTALEVVTEIVNRRGTGRSGTRAVSNTNAGKITTAEVASAVALPQYHETTKKARMKRQPLESKAEALALPGPVASVGD